MKLANVEAEENFKIKNFKSVQNSSEKWSPNSRRIKIFNILHQFGAANWEKNSKFFEFFKAVNWAKNRGLHKKVSQSWLFDH